MNPAYVSMAERNRRRIQAGMPAFRGMESIRSISVLLDSSQTLQIPSVRCIKFDPVSGCLDAVHTGTQMQWQTE